MPTGATINSKRHAETLLKLKAHIRRVRPDMQHIFFQHDNTRPHTSARTTAEIHRLGFTVLITHHTSDLAPSDFLLFPKLKEHLRGHYFLSDYEVKTAVKIIRQQDGQRWTHETI
jgi:hypothetical protein